METLSSHKPLSSCSDRFICPGDGLARVLTLRHGAERRGEITHVPQHFELAYQ
jgi:hypothetical protein